MPGAAYNTIGSGAASASANTITPGLPGGNAADTVLLAVCASKNNATHSTATAGWTKVGQVNSGANLTVSLWIGDGGSSAPVFTWAGVVACYAAAWNYLPPPADVIDVAIGANTSNNGTGTTHSTAAFTSTRNDSLGVYVNVVDVAGGLATPAGWTERGDFGMGAFGGEFTYGDKAIATSGSSSGAISVTGANGNWVQFQAEIMLKAYSDGFHVSSEEVSAWYDPVEGFAVVSEEVSAWYDPPDGLVATAMEVNVWLDADAGRRRQGIIT